MINVISAFLFIMSSSTSAWLLSPLEWGGTKWLNASVSEDELCEKCIIKQLLNSVFAWYHELSNPRVWVICLSLRLRQITQTSVLIIHDIMLNFIQWLFIIIQFTFICQAVVVWLAIDLTQENMKLGSESLYPGIIIFNVFLLIVLSAPWHRNGVIPHGLKADQLGCVL